MKAHQKPGSNRSARPTQSKETLSLCVSFRPGICGIQFSYALSNAVRVLRGNANGTFAAGVSFPAGSNPQALALGDFNADGALDLVTANFGGSDVSVLLNNGTGQFPSQQIFTVGTGPRAVAVADFNRDSRPDIVTPNETSGNVSVLLGNGNGTFQPQRVVPGLTSAYALAVLDATGDGILDLVISPSTSSGFWVLRGVGDGNFVFHTSVSLFGPARALAVVEINDDGRPDLTAALQFNDRLQFLTNTGTGTFISAATIIVGQSPSALAAADLNADGRLDIVSANQNTLSVVLNQPGPVTARFNGAFAGNGSLVTNVNAERLDGLDSTAFWKLSGNSSTTAGTDFLGTTDNRPLEFRVNGQQVLRLETNGNVGIGLVATQKLAVAGMVQSISGGFQFPDGTIQTTAAIGTIPRGMAEFSTVGSNSLVVPSGITRLLVEVWGAGGGGGSGDRSGAVSGGGGGSGGYSRTFLNVTSGATYTVVIGAGGAGGVGLQGVGGSGGVSQIQAPGGAILVFANGGSGGDTGNGIAGAGGSSDASATLGRTGVNGESSRGGRAICGSIDPLGVVGGNGGVPSGGFGSAGGNGYVLIQW